MSKAKAKVNLLTKNEKQLIDSLGDCFDLFEKIVSRGGERASDLTEIADKIVTLQNHVLAQAAGRAYPKLYRLLGESL